jgi:two-component sensor histidine kinase
VTADRWDIDPSGVELVVGELATNALEHGRTRFSVGLTITGHTLHVEVAERNSSPPYIQDCGLFSEAGRGLIVVEQCARRWGYADGASGGKKVWADLEL